MLRIVCIVFHTVACFIGRCCCSVMQVNYVMCVLIRRRKSRSKSKHCSRSPARDHRRDRHGNSRRSRSRSRHRSRSRDKDSSSRRDKDRSEFFKFFDEIYHSLSKFAFSKIHALYTFFLICRFTARFDI